MTSESYKDYPVWWLVFSGGNLCVSSLAGETGAPTCGPNKHFAAVVDASDGPTAGTLIFTYTSEDLG